MENGQYRTKTDFARVVRAPILPPPGRSRPKFPKRCCSSTCACVPNLVRISWVLPELFQNDWYFGPPSPLQYRLKATKGLQLPKIHLSLQCTEDPTVLLITLNVLQACNFQVMWSHNIIRCVYNPRSIDPLKVWADPNVGSSRLWVGCNSFSSYYCRIGKT